MENTSLVGQGRAVLTFRFNELAVSTPMRSSVDCTTIMSEFEFSAHTTLVGQTGEGELEVITSIAIAKHTLLLAGFILALGTIAGLLSQKLNIPDVAVFPLVGVVIGPQALGLIDIKADSALNQVILLFGASYILFDGGASLRLGVLKQVWITILALATVGVAITAALTGIAAYFVLGVPLLAALLLGAARIIRSMKVTSSAPKNAMLCLPRAELLGDIAYGRCRWLFQIIARNRSYCLAYLPGWCGPIPEE